MAAATTPGNNRDLRAHKTWLGLLEGHRVGIVVSPPALVAAQAYPNADIIPVQNALLALLTDKPRELREAIAERWGETGDVVLPGLGAFFEVVLGYRTDDLRPVPLDDLRWSVFLKEQHDTLSPTHVVLDPQDPDRALILVREEPANTDLDAVPPESPDGRGFRASPETRFERLLRDTGVPIGILFNGSSLRLVYAPRAETPGHLTFPIRAMCEVAGRPILAALVMLLHESRLFTGPTETRLPAILAKSRQYQATVSTQLAGQVQRALHVLVVGFQAANEVDPRGRGALLRGTLREDRTSVYGGLLTTLMRIVFILYAEDRELLPVSGIYPESYSVTGLFERLREDAGHYSETMHARYGAWAQLLTLFRVLHDGARSSEMNLPPRAGRLFDPDAYPFLEGREYDTRRVKGERILPPLVSDGVIYEVLGLLLYLDGDRLSYRSLEVQQIGSVYEAMMGFTLEEAEGVSTAVLPYHVVINLDQTLRLGDAAREKQLAEAGCKLGDAALKAWKAAKDVAGLLGALEKKVSPRTPDTIPVGGLYLQPTEERRKSGTHYTPPELTEPIVRTTLKPQLDALGGGSTPRPEQVLSLKVCDPAMGSGAFLVEACRFLGDALDTAWEVHGNAPVLPPDEDRKLHARRLVAQRCLYGVDKNPFAVDLAKLSLWLFTLARDQPFTFLDHALRQGDSLVGLTVEQVMSFDWKEQKGKAAQLSLLRPLVANVTRDAERKRSQIHELGDSPDVAEKARLHRDADDTLRDVRAIADLALVAFFAEKKDAAREKHRTQLVDKVVNPYLGGTLNSTSLGHRAAALNSMAPPVHPFHWELEFPEVFRRENPGFDAFVGNPPFMGGVKISETLGPNYLEFLFHQNAGSGGQADLIAFFFRRAFQLLRASGGFGLIGTNTIAQTDTRESGLTWIAKNGGVIFSARRRVRWPGAAAVVVSVIHVVRGSAPEKCLLDEREVPRITAFLFPKGSDESPARINSVPRKLSFLGSMVGGVGFTFEDNVRGASSSDEMAQLLKLSPRSKEVIFPFIGGEEINTSPKQEHRRHIINFGSMTEAEARQWPEVMAIVERLVRPERERVKRAAHRERWWQYGDRRDELYARMRHMERVIVNSQVSAHLSFAFQPTNRVFAHTLNVFTLDTHASFAALQSRPHEIWARFFASSMKDDLRYTASDCFETFPFPGNWQTNLTLESVGKTYNEFRAALMIKNNEGLTKTYNRFHDPNERSPDIHKLRTLHAEMDRAVLDAYGWTDIPTRYEFLLDREDDPSEDEEAGKKVKRKPYRYRFPDEIRDEILARLIELNRTRAEDERRRGVAVTRSAKTSDEDEAEDLDA